MGCGSVVDYAYTSRAHSVRQVTTYRARGVYSSSVRPQNLVEFNYRARVAKSASFCACNNAARATHCS